MGKSDLIEDETSLAYRLSNLRKDHDLSQKQLADQLHVTHSQISRIESSETKNPNIKTIKYETFNIIYNGKSNNILKNPKTIIQAIPADTTIKIELLEIFPRVTVSIWFAKISNPGSAYDIKNPSTNPADTTIQSLLRLVISSPSTAPNGVTPKSTPSKNKVKPITINIAPITNLNIKLYPSGTIVKLSKITIIVTGSTEKKTSFNFSLNIFKSLSHPFFALFL